MTDTPDILCIGSVLWDVIGRCPQHMPAGADRPGRITRLPGGVALNIAQTLARMGLRPALLTAIGRDAEGDELMAACADLGCDMGFVYRADDLPTDRYMAVEGANGLIAAIADAHTLEQAGDNILRPLMDGPLGRPAAPYTGTIALDGNLTEALLDEIALSPAFASADLRIAPASPGKAERLLPFLRSGRGTLYVNLEEASVLCQRPFDTAPEAAAALVDHGARRAIVTNGGTTCCDADAQAVVTEHPPQVSVSRVTGAGDTFMAAHIVAERNGAGRKSALDHALATAAAYVSGESA
ncbi:MAG: PfkB family carbohydrate kinase [Paracoccaceae bacterium]|nr:PfkB family carbohydrate kinase [Paracoccaceae bacterium]